jgi:hypothetical protein
MILQDEPEHVEGQNVTVVTDVTHPTIVRVGYAANLNQFNTER